MWVVNDGSKNSQNKRGIFIYRHLLDRVSRICNVSLFVNPTKQIRTILNRNLSFTGMCGKKRKVPELYTKDL